MTPNSFSRSLLRCVSRSMSFGSRQVPLNPPTELIPPESKLFSSAMTSKLLSLLSQHFFKAPKDPDMDTILTDSIMFPKNPDQQYRAPPLELPWPQDSGTYQKFDKILAQIQERQAYTTRPLDDFIAEIFTNVEDPKVRTMSADLVHIIRSQLSLTARQITDARMDMYLLAKGLKPVPAIEGGATVSRDDLTARIKAAEAYAEAAEPSNPGRIAKATKAIAATGVIFTSTTPSSSKNNISSNSSNNSSSLSINQRIIRKYNRLPPPPPTPMQETVGIMDTKAVLIFTGVAVVEDVAKPRIPSRRSVAAVSTGMAAADRRCVGPLDHWGGLSDSLPRIPAHNAVQRDSASSSLKGRDAGDRSRGIVPPWKESHRARFGSWFTKSALYNSQEDWRPQTSPQPTTIEPICGTSLLQDGDSSDGMLNASEERLSHLCRLEGRVFTRARSPRILQVPSVPLARSALPVSDTPIRSLTVATGLHEDPQTTIAMGATTRDPDSSISRRLADHGELEREIQDAYTPRSRKAGLPRLPDQRGEVDVGTVTVSGSPGLHVQHQGHDVVSPQVEAEGSQEGSYQDPQQRMEDAPESIFVCGQGDGNNSSSIPSPPDDAPPLGAQERSAEETDCVVDGHGISGRQSSGEPSVVGHAPEGMEWNIVGSVPNPARCVHTRIGQRLGDCNRTTDMGWHMDVDREGPTHQLEGASGGVSGSYTATGAGEDGQCGMRQHHDHRSHQQIWRNQVTSTDGSSRQIVETLSKYWHETQDHICALCLQSCGCTIASSSGATGMEPRSELLPVSGSPMGPTPRRSIRLARQHPAPEVYDVASTPTCHQQRRVEAPLDQTRQPVPLPTLESDPEDSPKTEAGEIGGNVDSPILAISYLVPSSTRDGTGSTNPDPETVRPATSRKRKQRPGQESTLVADGMENRRLCVIATGPSPEAASFVTSNKNALRTQK
ncbi:hypothetical protein EDD21DRAFT_406366 [Dissophora ornata]|nr:hypothetical protein EDD21DRAFT_406366 [Dissophora ornata]